MKFKCDQDGCAFHMTWSYNARPPPKPVRHTPLFDRHGCPLSGSDDDGTELSSDSDNAEDLSGEEADDSDYSHQWYCTELVPHNCESNSFLSAYTPQMLATVGWV